MLRRLNALVVVGLVSCAGSAEAFGCGRSNFVNDAGEQVEKQVGEPGSFECLVDNSLTEKMTGLGLTPNETVSTEMVSANISSRDGAPEVSYVFHYRIWAENFDLLTQLWSKERNRFHDMALALSKQITSQLCSPESEEAAYFTAGGRAHITIVLNSSVGLKKFFHEELVDMEIADCEAP